MTPELEQRIRGHMGEECLDACKRGDETAVTAVYAVLGQNDGDELRAALADGGSADESPTPTRRGRRSRG